MQEALAASLKRRMAPVLKSVIGSWWLAQQDTAPEVASAARDSFQAAFPGPRHQEALIFCAQEVCQAPAAIYSLEVPQKILSLSATPVRLWMCHCFKMDHAELRPEAFFHATATLILFRMGSQCTSPR